MCVDDTIRTGSEKQHIVSDIRREIAPPIKGCFAVREGGSRCSLVEAAHP